MRTYIEYLTIPWATVFFALIALFWHHFISNDSHPTNQRDIMMDAQGPVGGALISTVQFTVIETIEGSFRATQITAMCSRNQYYKAWKITSDGLDDNRERYPFRPSTRLIKHDQTGWPFGFVTANGNPAWNTRRRLTIYTEGEVVLTLEFETERQREDHYNLLSRFITFIHDEPEIAKASKWSIQQDGISYNGDGTLKIYFLHASISKYKEHHCILVGFTVKFIGQRSADNQDDNYLTLDFEDAEHRNKFFNEFQGARIIHQYYKESYISTLLSVTEGAAVFKMQQGSSSFIAKVMQKQEGRPATVEYKFQKEAYEMMPDFIAEPLEHIPSDKILDSGGFSIFKMEYVDVEDARHFFDRNTNLFQGKQMMTHLQRFIDLSTFFKPWNKKFCYGDLKPQNVLFGETKIKLIDFGAVSRGSSASATFTSEYCSPLRAYGERIYEMIPNSNPGIVAKQNMIQDMYSMILSILKLIGYQYGEKADGDGISPFLAYYQKHRNKQEFAKFSTGNYYDKLLNWKIPRCNMAFRYRGKEDHLVKALQESSNEVPEQIINFVQELVDGDLKFKWCEPDPNKWEKCYKHWDWQMLQKAAEQLHIE